MKIKQYIRFQLKSWLPLIIAVGAVVLTITMIIGLNATPSISFRCRDGVSYSSTRHLRALASTSFSGIAAMLIPSMLAACALPFFAYSHRYGKVRADCFLSLPVKNGKITQIRILLLGAILLAIYLASFLIGSLAAIVKQVLTVSVAKEAFQESLDLIESYSIQMGSFGWYFLAWPLGAVIVAAFYLTNSFLAGLGSNVLQGIIALVGGQLALCLLLPLTINLPAVATGEYQWMFDFFGASGPFFCVGAFYVPVILLEGTLGVLETNTEACWSYAARNASQWVLWMGVSLFLLTAGAALVHLLLGKEPGGEFAGESRPRNLLATLVPHFAFATALLAFVNLLAATYYYGFASIFILFVTSFVWIDGIYYIVTSLYNHSFKLDLKNWLLYAGVNSFMLLLSIVVFSVRASFSS